MEPSLPVLHWERTEACHTPLARTEVGGALGYPQGQAWRRWASPFLQRALWGPKRACSPQTQRAPDPGPLPSTGSV